MQVGVRVLEWCRGSFFSPKPRPPLRLGSRGEDLCTGCGESPRGGGGGGGSGGGGGGAGGWSNMVSRKREGLK